MTFSLRKLDVFLIGLDSPYYKQALSFLVWVYSFLSSSSSNWMCISPCGWGVDHPREVVTLKRSTYYEQAHLDPWHHSPMTSCVHNPFGGVIERKGSRHLLCLQEHLQSSYHHGQEMVVDCPIKDVVAKWPNVAMGRLEPSYHGEQLMSLRHWWSRGQHPCWQVALLSHVGVNWWLALPLVEDVA